MHVIEIMANNSSVPYFKWFADHVPTEPGLKMTFVALYPTRPTMLDDMKERGCDCVWIPYDSSNRKRGMLRSLWKMYRLFRKLKPDVVHTHLFDDSFPGMIAARMAGVKARVITKQETTFHYYFTPQWVWADRFNNRNATHIHAVATENRKFILDIERAPENKVHLVRNGFPYDIMTDWNEADRDALMEKFDLKHRFVVGTVARLIEWKGHDYIVEAARELVKDYPDLYFVWAGTGPEEFKAKLRQKITDYGLENNIRLLDWIERYQMPSLYRCMDLYLHPALREPFGFVISEALMNGVPVAACPTGSMDLIKHREEGYVLKEESVEDIVEAVRFFRENDDRRKTIAKAGHEHALKNLQFQSMWEGHLNLYRQALAGKNGRPPAA